MIVTLAASLNCKSLPMLWGGGALQEVLVTDLTLFRGVYLLYISL